MYSIIACRTRHDLSSASSMIAGRRLSDKSSMSRTRNPDQARTFGYVAKVLRTTVDRFQFADNIQTNLGELVL